mmetsp:Transcript_79941/g.258505  ORF Transcript_79941/g.258505 Transcript_79941/m.258505 type:complete len:673 (+) Transcript_79941:38-2056(+)
MSRRLLGLFCVASGLAACDAAVAGVTPVQKVIQLLDGMLAKGKEEKHAEEVEFAKFQAWCDSTRKATTKSIEEGAAQITQLDADIAKSESDAEVLGQEIDELEGKSAQAKYEAASAKALREKENGDYMAQHQDLSESIDACEKAVSVLKSKGADVPQSLAQVRSSPKIPAHAIEVIESFLAMKAGQEPKANAYEFQSGGVVEMLEKLTGKFKDQRLALQKAEMNAKSNYEMLLQQLTDNIRTDESRSSEKSASKAGTLSDAANFKGDLEVTEKIKAEDEKTLSDTKASCNAKSVEFEQNQVTRAEEIKAIKNAMEILSSDAVSGNSETHLPSLPQVNAKGRALAQLRSSVQNDGDVRQKAAAYLQGRAKDLGSRYLSVMASRVTEDPFGKVKKMLKDLIVKLMEEANSEADHHAYCTSELATNKMTREDKSSEAEKLSADADQLTATEAQLASEITELSDAMAELQGARAEATKNRGEEKATNTKTIADSKEAQVAVEQAIAVLREFYGKETDASSLLQAGKTGAAATAKRSTHREPYTGMGSSSGGILGLLDVILSDFARLETETSSSEDQAQSAYEKYMNESDEDLAVKGTTVEHKASKKQQTEESLRSTQKELSLTQQELDAALSYYDKLKADCVDNNLSYEDRVSMRKDEIQSLKEAMRILNGEESLV